MPRINNRSKLSLFLFCFHLIFYTFVLMKFETASCLNEQNPSFDRDKILKCIQQNQICDVLVIGGGASGLGIALDACMRGYKTILIEQSDFAKGTSSRSTKLVHGGVRYLKQGDVKMVRQASIERGLLYRNAPHLVKDQTFIVPVYSFWGKVKYTIGLKLYDKIAGKLSMGNSRFISTEKAVEMLPGIKTRNLRGAILYYDGQFDDSRLALNLAQTITENGGLALNYAKVTGLHKDLEGNVNGARVLDIETGEEMQITAKATVNATGVFVDDILQMDMPDRKKSICVSQGVHLVLDKAFFPSEHALMIPETSDGRVLFAVPWHNKIVVGTTDTPVKTASMEPVALEKEIEFILETAGKYFTSKPTRQDVLSVFAGLRPLAAPAHSSEKTKEISRSHKIVVSASKLFTILGGKWNTYRKMGEDMVTRIEKEMGWQPTMPGTEHLKIHGHCTKTNFENPFYFYGSDEALLVQNINGSAEKWLSPKLKIHEQQVIWAVKKEMARTLEDVLGRRTRALFLDARESRRIAPAVAEIMAKVLDKDAQWQHAELEKFYNISHTYILS